LPKSGNSQSSETSSTEIWQHPATGIMQASEFSHQNTAGAGIQRHPAIVAGCRRTRFRQNLAGIRSLIRSDLAKMAGLTESGGVLPESGQPCSLESGDSFIFTFRNFFVRIKRRKIFLRKLFVFEINFVENILRRKPFYVKTNGA